MSISVHVHTCTTTGEMSSTAILTLKLVEQINIDGPGFGLDFRIPNSLVAKLGTRSPPCYQVVEV